MVDNLSKKKEIIVSELLPVFNEYFFNTLNDDDLKCKDTIEKSDNKNHIHVLLDL